MSPRTGPRPAGRSPRRTAHVVRDIVLGLLLAWLLSFEHQKTRVMAAMVAAEPEHHGMDLGPLLGPPWMRNRPRDGAWQGDGWWDVASSVPWSPFVVGLAVVIGAAIALRGCWPRIAFGVVALATTGYLLLDGPFLIALAAPAICVFTLARIRPVTEWWIPAGIGALMLWSAAWREPWLGLDQAGTWFQIVFGLAVIMVPALIRVLKQDRRTAHQERRAEELRRVADVERLRLARDVHDVVGHSLSMISLQAGVALHVIDKNPDQVRESLQAIRDSSRSSLAELRHTLGALRSETLATDGSGAPEPEPDLAPTPDLATVPSLVDGVRAAGRSVALEMDGDVDAVPASFQHAAHRIIQESLTNAVRHAPEASIAVTVTVADQLLIIDVADTGTPGASAARTVEVGNGLRGMSERVAALNGALDYGPQPSSGFTVHAELPLPALG